VFVRETGEVVVSRIGIAAAAVGRTFTHGEIVVALDADHTGVMEQREDAVGVRPEAAEVAQTVRRVGAASASVGERPGERPRVTVHTAEQRDARQKLRHASPVWWQVTQAAWSRTAGPNASARAPAPTRAPGSPARMGQA